MAKVNKNPRDVKLFLERGIENIYPDIAPLEKALTSGKRLKVYMGVDPTGATLHMGHAIPLRKLGEMQRLGHEVIFMIGDFTAMIGDPTDKSATRVRLTRKEVLQNCKNYKKQASKFLTFTGENAAKFLFNSKWLAKMTFSDVVELSSHFTVQQMAERDMFEKRMKMTWTCKRCKAENYVSSDVISRFDKQGDKKVAYSARLLNEICSKCNQPNIIERNSLGESKPVYLHEFLYPLMQGYDSVAMDVDMEIGGNDQTFNMLAGRTLLKEMKGKEKFVVTTTLLEDASGKKMGKTEGNMIALDDGPEEMYGKVMSWTDGMILPGFRLCTDVEIGEVDRIEGLMKKGGNPVEYKHRLAREIVKLYHSDKAGWAAREHFNKVHKKHDIPDDIPTLKVKAGMTIVDVLVASKLVASKTDARRQIEQGGVKVDGKVIKDINAEVSQGSVIQKGKRHFVKLV